MVDSKKALKPAGVVDNKRTVHRSPNYPSIGLTDALEKIRTIYQHERRNTTSGAVAASHMGYPKMTGPAGRALSALKQYGLLDDLGEGKVRVSDDAFRILILHSDSPERQAMLTRAALKPRIFSELQSYYKDGLPSDATLREYLVLQKEFNPDSVDQFIRIFRATIILANPTGADYTGSQQDEEAIGSEEVGMETPVSTAHQAATDPKTLSAEQFRQRGGHPWGMPSELREAMPYRYETGAMNAPLAPNEQDLKINVGPDRQARIIFDGPITQEAADMIAAILNVQKRVFRKEADVPQSSADDEADLNQ
jgi:hypothetical protein